MKLRYKADFEGLPWEPVMEGVRHKLSVHGDGIYIPDGPAHRHRARVLSEKALVFFVEKTRP